MPTVQSPKLTLSQTSSQQGALVTASGTWQVHALAHDNAIKAIDAQLKPLQGDTKVQWDLSAIDSMDHIGAQLFWNAWGKRRPAQLTLAPSQEEFFRRIEETGPLKTPPSRANRLTPVMKLGMSILLCFEHMQGFIALVGQLTQDIARFARRPSRGPFREISANISHAGIQALDITALVG